MGHCVGCISRDVQPKGCDFTMLNYIPPGYLLYSPMWDADDRATGETKAYVTMLNLVCTINKI